MWGLFKAALQVLVNIQLSGKSDLNLSSYKYLSQCNPASYVKNNAMDVLDVAKEYKDTYLKNNLSYKI